MYKIFFLLLPIFLHAESLKSLLQYAHKNNDLVLSKELSQKSKQKEVDSQEAAYYPTIDAGIFYQNLDKKTTGLAGDTYAGYAKIGFDIYDGGRKSSLLKQKEDEYKASKYDVEDIKTNVSLQIVHSFFSIKSLEASLKSREEAQHSLKIQLDRMNAFYAASLATKDDVDRLQASYDTNIYDMEALKLEILTAKSNLSLQVGREITQLEESKFIEDKTSEFELTDTIKSLEYSKKALNSFSNSLESAYYPQVRIEDTYSVYGYGDTSLQHPKGVDTQNKLMLTANIRLYDNHSISNAKQALQISSQSLGKQIEYKSKEQKMLFKLAQARIDTSKIKIKSAESALKSATSAFDTIEQKYTARIVDNVVYLDALTSKTSAISLYETSLNDLQVAYATYYYYAGKNLEEFLNE